MRPSKVPAWKKWRKAVKICWLTLDLAWLTLDLADSHANEIAAYAALD